MKVMYANELKPVSASYSGDDDIIFKGINHEYTYRSGMPLYSQPIINSLIDIKTNKYTIFGLTPSKPINEVLGDSTKTIGTKGILAISVSNTLESMYGDNDAGEFVREVPFSSDQCVLFSFKHVETINGDYYYRIGYRDKVLTRGNGVLSAYPSYQQFEDGDNQVFKIDPDPSLPSDGCYIVGRDGIAIDSDTENPDVVHLYDADGQRIIHNAPLTTDFSGYDSSNRWVRYYNFYNPEYSKSESILSVDRGRSIDDINTNYLVHASSSDITVTGNTANIPFNILPLKNFKTINSELSLIPELGDDAPDAVNFRDYQKIYTGGNQLDGYNNINLGYSSTYSSVMKFKADQYTYFHIPKTANEIPVANSAFEHAGAFAGTIPAYSDRIYKRLANYEDKVWWGGGSNEGIQNGTWLCSWLSAGYNPVVWDGVTGYAEVDDSEDLFNFGSMDFTIEGEADLTKPDDDPESYNHRVLISKHSWWDDKLLWRVILSESGDLQFECSATGLRSNYHYTNIPVGLVPQERARWKFIKRGTNHIECYINGIRIPDGSTSTSLSVPVPAIVKSDKVAVLIGACFHKYSNPFTPDNIAYRWDREFDWVKVTSEADSGYWIPSRSSGYRLPDSSGKHHDATLIGMGEVGSIGTWMERYFDPSIITYDNALSVQSEGIVDTIGMVPNPNPVIDVVSNMTIEPGAYYKYFHIGNETIEQMLGSNSGINTDHMRIRLLDFDTGSIVNDEGDNNNDGNVQNYHLTDAVSMDIGFGSEFQSALLLNANANIKVNSSHLLNIEDSATTLAWFFNGDWDTTQSTTLYTNYFKGGYKLELINHGLYYSYIIPKLNIIEPNKGDFLIMPSEFTDDRLLVTRDVEGVPKSAVVDLDGYFWIAMIPLNSTETHIFKLTQTGEVLESVTVDDFVVDQIIISDDNIGYAVGADHENSEYPQESVIKFNLYNVSDISREHNSLDGYAYMNMGNVLEYSMYDTVDLDQFTDGYVCKIVDNGDQLSLNGSLIAVATEIFRHVCCDADSNIFATVYDINGQLKLYRYDKDSKSKLNIFIINGEATSLVNATNAVFISKEMVDGNLRDVIYWVGLNTTKRYIITEDDNEMEEISSVVSEESFTGAVDGDFSGYKLNKRIHHIHDDRSYFKYSTILDDDSNAQKRVLMGSTLNITDNWHSFSIVKDDDQNNMTMYIDGYTVDTIYNTNFPIKYILSSALNICGVTNGALDVFTILGLNNRNLDGAVSEFAIYDIPLNSIDIGHLYRNKFTSSGSMSWVLDTGKQYFVEEVQHLFKFQKPAMKSQMFNIVIKNMDIPDDDKALYESDIRDNIEEITPANTKLVDIIWR